MDAHQGAQNPRLATHGSPSYDHRIAKGGGAQDDTRAKSLSRAALPGRMGPTNKKHPRLATESSQVRNNSPWCLGVVCARQPSPVGLGTYCGVFLEQPNYKRDGMWFLAHQNSLCTFEYEQMPTRPHWAMHRNQAMVLAFARDHCMHPSTYARPLLLGNWCEKGKQICVLLRRSANFLR